MIEKLNIETSPGEKITEGIVRHLAFGTKMSFACYHIGKEIIPKRLENHTHPQETAAFWLKGRARVFLGKEVFEVGPGDFYFVPPNEEHGAEVLEGPAIELDFFQPPREDMRKGNDPARQSLKRENHSK